MVATSRETGLRLACRQHQQHLNDSRARRSLTGAGHCCHRAVAVTASELTRRNRPGSESAASQANCPSSTR
jgi:hypothetical protein